MRAFFDALILMASPVAGLRPMRAGRSIFANLQKPEMATGSPLDTTADTTSVKPCSTVSTCRLSTPVWAATAFTSSRLFMHFLLGPDLGHESMARRKAQRGESP